MAEIRVNATGGLKLFDADDSHYAQIIAGTITSNVDVLTLGHAAVVMGTKLDLNGNNLILDADADTYLDGGTADDVVDVYVAGAKDWKFGANSINVLSGTTLTIDSGATITNSGTANGFGSADPASADGDTLGTASLEWSDLFLADGGIIKFGNDQDTLLTHTDGTGLTLNSTNKLCFNDASQFIQGSSATVLSIGATDEIDLTATAVDLNGTLDVSGATLMTTLGVITAKDLGVGIHIRTADSGASVGGNADELVIEGSGHSGMSILSGTSSDGSIFFGDSGDNDHGIMSYEHDNARFSFTANATANFFVTDGGCSVPDDKGIQFGTGPDYYLGAAAGEASLELNGGSTQGAGANEGLINFLVTPTDGSAHLKVQGGEGDAAALYLYADQGEGGGGSWGLYATGTPSTISDLQINNDSNTSAQTYVFDYLGSANADSTWDDNTWDYAELFPWKTELSNDSDINALWGKTVVLDGDFVRIAEAGEEALVMGVVRPKGSTSSHGDGLKWKGKYGIDVWGNYEYEDYTHVYWQEFLPNGNVAYRHSYPKNEIPSFRLKDGIGRDLNNHTKEENFTLNRNSEKTPVVVPQTEEEKTATNYKEKTLNRRKFSSDYNPDLPYIRRKDRPKEWVLIGMLGQVPIRDTAIIPTHWKKMKDLESGIDKYFIFNK